MARLNQHNQNRNHDYDEEKVTQNPNPSQKNEEHTKEDGQPEGDNKRPYKSKNAHKIPPMSIVSHHTASVNSDSRHKQFRTVVGSRHFR